MAMFEIQSGGKTYQIEAPDQAAALRAVKSVPQTPYSGSILPFSKDAQGNVSFDSNAGIVGAAKRLVGGIDDVMSGRVDSKSGQGIANITDAALVGTPVSAATRGGLGWAGAAARKKTPVTTPGGDELLATGGSQFDMVRGMDVRYHIAPIQNLAFKLQSRLHKDGFRNRDESASGTFAELAELLKPAEQGAFASIDDLLAVRRSLQKTAQNFNKPTDQKAAVIAIKAIDDFIENPDPASVMAGPAAEAGALWKTARGNYATGKQSEGLLGLEGKADRRAKANNSGLNIDNTIRQRVASFLERPQLTSGLKPEEIKMLQTVADGTATRNTLRWFGNLLGGGGGLAAAIVGGGTGATLGGLPGLALGVAVPGAGLAAKMAGNRMTRSALHKADEAIRQRSPLYQERAAAAPAPPPLASPGTRSMMGRAVIGGRAAAPSAPPPPQMTKEQFEEYLRQKALFEQGA